MESFPRNTMHDKAGQTLAVTPNMANIPAYQQTPTLTFEQMQDQLPEGGYIMQQDDAWLPPFTLISK